MRMNLRLKMIRNLKKPFKELKKNVKSKKRRNANVRLRLSLELR